MTNIINKSLTFVEWDDGTTTVYQNLNPDLLSHLADMDGINRAYCMRSDALTRMVHDELFGLYTAQNVLRNI